MSTPKQDYIERITKWLMPDRADPDLASKARLALGLDGVYTGKSQRIWRMLRLAYLRGVRRGASAAWSARQPVTLRDSGNNEPDDWISAESDVPIADALAGAKVYAMQVDDSVEAVPSDVGLGLAVCLPLNESEEP